ncbi:hypothetical protein [Candidatus Pyrohabitans sp.]
MELLSLEALVLWFLAFIGFIVIFLGVTVLAMKLSRNEEEEEGLLPEEFVDEGVELSGPDKHDDEGEDSVSKVVI